MPEHHRTSQSLQTHGSAIERGRLLTRYSTIAVPVLSRGTEQSLTASPTQVQRFVEEVCIPADTVYAAQLGTGDERWHGHPSIMEDLKEEARKRGLFNMFLPKNHFKEGAGFSNVEYGLMAEQLGKSRTASEVCRSTATPAYFQLLCGMGGVKRIGKSYANSSP